MQNNLIVSMVQTAVLALIAVILIFRSGQTNHLEELVLESQRETEALADTIERLQQALENGDIAMAVGPGATPGQTGGTEYHARFFGDQWADVIAPGNFLSPATDRRRVQGGEDGGTMHRAFMSDIPGLNPLTQNAADVSELYHYVQETLGERQRSDPDRWIPELAARIEVNDDYTEYHVWLKQGVMWHPPAVDLDDEQYAWLRGDHEVVADDFVFFLELVKNPQVEAAFLRNYYEDCEGIEIINDHEFIVRWAEPRHQSISFTMGMPPLPRWLYGHDENGQPFDDATLGRQFNDHWYNQRAIGTGPYRFVEWEQGGAIVLERFPDYHGERPLVERIDFRVISDPTARLNGLRAGELDYVPLQQTQYKNEVADGGTPGFENGDLDHELFQGTVYRYLGWNADGPYFSDRRVRLAMTHALDRELLLEENFHGLGRIITGNFFIDGPDYNHDLEPYAYDLHRAAELLTEAGWVDNDDDGIREKIIDGQRMNFEFGMVTYGYRPEFVAAMEHYRNDLRRIGVVMNVEPVEWAVMVERMQEKDFDAYTGGWQLGWEADPYQIWHSSQADVPRGSNRVGFRNAEADEIIEEARRTFDPEERSRLFNRFHEIVYEEQPYTFWFAPLEIGAWRDRVQNVNFAPLRPFDSSLNWYLAD